jgi:hypothetical protein
MSAPTWPAIFSNLRMMNSPCPMPSWLFAAAISWAASCLGSAG